MASLSQLMCRPSLHVESSPTGSATAAAGSSIYLSDIPVPTSPGYEFSDDGDSQREINNDPEGSDVEMVDEEHYIQYMWIYEDSEEDGDGDDVADDDGDVRGETKQDDAMDMEDESMEDEDDEEYMDEDVDDINLFIHSARAPRTHAWALSLPAPVEMDMEATGLDSLSVASETFAVEWPAGLWVEAGGRSERTRAWADSLPARFCWGQRWESFMEL